MGRVKIYWPKDDVDFMAPKMVVGSRYLARTRDGVMRVGCTGEDILIHIAQDFV